MRGDFAAAAYCIPLIEKNGCLIRFRIDLFFHHRKGVSVSGGGGVFQTPGITSRYYIINCKGMIDQLRQVEKKRKGLRKLDLQSGVVSVEEKE